MGVLLIAACVAFGLGVGLKALRNGLRILNGRPVVVRLHLRFFPLALLFLFNALFFVLRFPPIGLDIRLLCAGVMLAMIALWFVVRLSSSRVLLEVHNVDYDSVYQAVLDMLEEVGIDYDQYYVQYDAIIALRSLACEISVKGAHDDRTVRTRFAGRDRKPVAAEVSSRLKSMPVSDSVIGYSSSAYMCLAEAVFMFALTGVLVALWL